MSKRNWSSHSAIYEQSRIAVAKLRIFSNACIVFQISYVRCIDIRNVIYRNDLREYFLSHSYYIKTNLSLLVIAFILERLNFILYGTRDTVAEFRLLENVLLRWFQSKIKSFKIKSAFLTCLGYELQGNTWWLMLKTENEIYILYMKIYV